jgi:hypothetical protein
MREIQEEKVRPLTRKIAAIPRRASRRARRNAALVIPESALVAIPASAMRGIMRRTGGSVVASHGNATNRSGGRP